jgi:hypothetical protein
MPSQNRYQDTLSATLEALGWHDMWVRPVFDARANRWVTPTTTKGWPDLSCIHPRSGVLLFAEVKGACPAPKRGWSTADVKPHQLDWLHRLHCNPAAAAVVFRPSDDWTLVAGWLADPGTLRSGYGWLDPEQHRPVVTYRQVAHLLRV